MDAGGTSPWMDEVERSRRPERENVWNTFSRELREKEG
jgi:hypothetical protein